METEISSTLPEIGRVYRHFKGNYYYIENIAKHSETSELMVVYRPLYDGAEAPLWVRPASMFFEEVDPGRPDNLTGQTVRFELVKDIKKNWVE